MTTRTRARGGGGALWTKAIPEVDLQAAGDALFG